VATTHVVVVVAVVVRAAADVDVGDDAAADDTHRLPCDRRSLPSCLFGLTAFTS
jgi:hypothetical protein